MWIEFGTARDNDQNRIDFTPEALFGRHCAIVGSTGGGKSWTVARVVEQAARFNCKIIIFDPSGEFHTLKEHVRHVRVGAEAGQRDSVLQVSVPYFELRESDLFGIFNPHGLAQATKLRAAMKSLKLAIKAPMLVTGGTILKAHRNKIDYEREYRTYLEYIDSPYNRFDLRHLIPQIQNECVDFQRSAMEPNVWGGPNSLELSHCVPMMARIQDIINSTNLSPIFNPGKLPSLFDEFQSFFADPKSRVLCVGLEGLSFQHRTREIVTNAIGRYLLELARNGHFRRKPLVVVLDEAHQFLGNTNPKKEDEYPLDSFGIIAKEGRKYSLTLCLATQRPRDIPEDVLSQVGMMVVHRLTNDADRNVIERASGELREGQASVLPSLKSGEAMVLSSDLPAPLLVKVDAPECRPDSRGPDYQGLWSLDESGGRGFDLFASKTKFDS